MAEFFEVSDDLIAAAAERSPPLPKSTDAAQALKKWVAKQSRDGLQELAERLLASDAAATRAETLSRIRDETGAAAWPLAEPALRGHVDLAKGRAQDEITGLRTTSNARSPPWS